MIINSLPDPLPFLEDGHGVENFKLLIMASSFRRPTPIQEPTSHYFTLMRSHLIRKQDSFTQEIPKESGTRVKSQILEQKIFLELCVRNRGQKPICISLLFHVLLELIASASETPVRTPKGPSRVSPASMLTVITVLPVHYVAVSFPRATCKLPEGRYLIHHVCHAISSTMLSSGNVFMNS